VTKTRPVDGGCAVDPSAGPSAAGLLWLLAPALLVWKRRRS